MAQLPCIGFSWHLTKLSTFTMVLKGSLGQGRLKWKMTLLAWKGRISDVRVSFEMFPVSAIEGRAMTESSRVFRK